jgi:hypothetical protein
MDVTVTDEVVVVYCQRHVASGARQAAFGTFTAMQGEVERTTSVSPNLQTHVERVVQAIKHGVLNAFCVVSDAHGVQLLRLT